MTLNELSQYNINEMLNNEHLIFHFKEIYKASYGVYPTCTSCAIANEFRKLIESETKININQMEYKYRAPKGEILTYINADGKRVRCYDTNLNDEFVRGFLTVSKFADKEEIDKRKSLFKVLPIIEETIEAVKSVEENIEVKVEPLKKKPTSKRKKK